jgi:hypothetical protein
VAFTPTVPLNGIAGWRFLERTAERQQAAFEKSPDVARDVAYFEGKIGSITAAADLVADRRLLKVALGAFGMEGEIDKRAFIRRVLEEGTDAPSDLAVRLTDPAWRKLSDAFGFADAAGPKTASAGFAATITAAYKTRACETAVGEANNDMRLAMNFRREIAALAASGDSGGSWYSVLGSKPLRTVFEKAFGLPTAFGQIDIDQQREVLRDRARRLFGKDTLDVFKDPAAVDKLLQRFLARSQVESASSTSGGASAALALLRPSGSSGLFNLIASKL